MMVGEQVAVTEEVDRLRRELAAADGAEWPDLSPREQTEYTDAALALVREGGR